MVSTDEKTWEDARAACLAMKGDLASIISSEEQDLVTKELDSQGIYNAWIGLNDRETDGTYKWTDKRLLYYTNWGPSEPNGGSGENCVHMMQSAKNRKWNDLSCLSKKHYVCKILRNVNYD